MRRVNKLTCQEVLDQLQEYLDDAAHAELVEAVDHHLGGCQHCRFEVDTIKGVVRIFQSERHVVIPDGLAVKLQVALEQVYRDGCRRDEGSSST
jgi:predicted anti-sigma-YlaC factor YlaD